MDKLALKVGLSFGKPTHDQYRKGFESYIKSYNYKDIENTGLTALEEFWDLDNNKQIVINVFLLTMICLLPFMNTLTIIMTTMLFIFGHLSFGTVSHKYKTIAHHVSMLEKSVYEDDNTKEEFSFDECLKQHYSKDKRKALAFFEKEIEERNNMITSVILNNDDKLK